MELVSIILPAFNANRFIAETITSVINQSYTNWELLIVNDGSSDDTEKTIASYLNDNRIKYISKQNSGVSDTRNNGIHRAKGNYIAFLDADDIWKENNLTKKIECLHNTNSDAVYSKCELINEDSLPINKELTGSDEPVLADILLLKGNYITAPSGIVVKKTLIETVGVFDINLSNNADQDFWIRILVNGLKINFIPESLWKYRVHSKNMSSNIKLLESDSIYMFNKIGTSTLFSSKLFKRKCYASLYFMLAGSWWKNANNKTRGVYFIIKALLTYPPSILKLIK
jgi:glycosyltransferase involved in cell wall biosynthesis